MQSGAILDSTGQYRYLLWRAWNPQAPKVGFILLNPSTADATANDPTIRRCLQFAQAWEYGALEVVNLFAYRTTHPLMLRHCPEPVGPENNDYLQALPQRSQLIVVGWGNWGTLFDRDRVALSLLARQTDLYCFGITRRGQPRHPLYLQRRIPLELFQTSN